MEGMGGWREWGEGGNEGMERMRGWEFVVGSDLKGVGDTEKMDDKNFIRNQGGWGRGREGYT